MKSNRLKKKIEFIKEIDKKKYIEQKPRLFNSDRREKDMENIIKTLYNR